MQLDLVEQRLERKEIEVQREREPMKKKGKWGVREEEWEVEGNREEEVEK